MNFVSYSFRHAHVILNEDEFIDQYKEVEYAILGITDDQLIERHESYGNIDPIHTPKSISRAINELLKESFVQLGWSTESAIFQDNHYQGDIWRLDFAKKDISIEVAFNHSTVIAWNLIKPVLASELNHVEKAIQTKVGIIITTTEDLKSRGGFDGAVGTYEKFIDYLKPLGTILTVPLLIIGLQPPLTFVIDQFQLADRKKIGRVRRLQQGD